MKALWVCIFSLPLYVQSVYSNNLKNELLADIKAYCRYIEAKNNAKKTALTSPDFVIRAQNSTNDYPYQNSSVVAISKDLVDLGKSKQIRELINDECNYYQLKQEALLQIQFALANVQKKALLFKLKSIRSVKKTLNTRLRVTRKKMENRNDTISSLYKIDSVLQKIEEKERDIEANLAMQQPFNIKTIPINQLLQKIQIAEKKRQSTLNNLEKLNNWSLQVQVGAQQNSLAFNHNQTTQPYAGLFFRYNLGSINSSNKLHQSLNYYSDWKMKQVNGMQKKLSHLIQSLTLLLPVEEQRLQKLMINHQKYDQLIKKLSRVDSIKANHLKQEIELDNLMVEIELAYLNYFTLQLKEIIG